MLQLEPTRWFSWAFTVADDGKPLGTLDISAWRERGELHRGGPDVHHRPRRGSSRATSGSNRAARSWRPRPSRARSGASSTSRSADGRCGCGRARRGAGRWCCTKASARSATVTPRGDVVPPRHRHAARHAARCRSACSCCGWPCSSGSATPTPRPRRASRRVVPAVALHYVERPAPAPLAAAIECVWSVSDRVSRDRAAARSSDSRRLPRADRPPRRSLRPRRRRAARAPAGGVPRRHAVAAVDRAGAAARRDDRRALPPGRAHRAVRRVARRHRGSRGAARRAARAAGRARRRHPPRARPGVRAAGRRGVAAGARRRASPGGRVPAPACADAVRAIHRRRGRVGVEALAAAVGLPRRRLERLFRRETALTPKQYIRIVRLTGAPGAARRAGSGSPDRRRARRRLLRSGAHGARLQGAHRAAGDGASRRRRRARRALHAPRSSAPPADGGLVPAD